MPQMTEIPRRINSRALAREPVLRLLAGNLLAGAAASAVMMGGLLVLNPQHLRELIFADQGSIVALGLLLFGLLITFGSAAMGSAIMTLGADGEAQ
jgi:hypothetical protein